MKPDDRDFDIILAHCPPTTFSTVHILSSLLLDRLSLLFALHLSQVLIWAQE